MFNLGPTEIIMVCAVGILIFGHKLPSVARSLGKSVISFRDGLKGIEDDIDSSTRVSMPAEKPSVPRKIDAPTI